MNHAERKAEWIRYLNACHLRLGGLLAVEANDGKAMLADVLKTLKLGTAQELLDWLRESRSA